MVSKLTFSSQVDVHEIVLTTTIQNVCKLVKSDRKKVYNDMYKLSINHLKTKLTYHNESGLGLNYCFSAIHPVK